MSFTGDLEHLPIVDIVQLIHAARKTGTLTVQSRKGTCQLVFKDGFIGSASNLHSHGRIGQILLEMKALREEDLEAALAEQKQAGHNRKPLIATLMSRKLIDKDVAFKGLQLLIEMTIVEILTWKAGTFSLDVDNVAISDEYRYFPEKLNEEFLLNSQNALMDALRIYDEKKRDGELSDEDEPSVEGTEPGESGWSISEDDLGLADLDQLETRIPGVFSVLEERDPVAIHRERIGTLAPAWPDSEKEKVLAYLGDAADRAKESPSPEGGARAVIVFSSDEFLAYLLTTLGKNDGSLIFSTNDDQDLDLIIDQSLHKGIQPLLVMDCPQKARAGYSADKIHRLRREKKMKYPRLETLQLAFAAERDFILQSYREGARAVFPRPSVDGVQENGAAETLTFIEALRLYLNNFFEKKVSGAEDVLARGVLDLIACPSIPAVHQSLLKTLAGIFPRVLTLAARQEDFVSEKGIGFGGGDREARAVVSVCIPLETSSLLRKVADEQRPFYGLLYDGGLSTPLYEALGAATTPKALLFPLHVRGRTLAVIYADFGDTEAQAVPMEQLERLAAQAALVAENALYRKKLEKTTR
ncbi:DUF4388 domain-containing protein [Desulfuromonas sp. AOP6]|uniref:DUF4388 domain-containing protein n=1 Tax=Desulfuromonas sp. AOP6 TaxID=1566351 RepID=UPI00127187B7|nr:DUF4388 domain-containing protein [Desulfuromonas sp. AOP6]BCA78748.1 hypothetical protein AOP6_0535 [Desulfuromonas sp. AOP6]